MVKHNLLPDADLHTPKGADSALSNQFLMANGDGTSSFQNFLVDIGEWDVAVDGAIPEFTGLGDYAYLELQTFDFITDSGLGNYINCQVGNTGGYQTGDTYQTFEYYRTASAEGWRGLGGSSFRRCGSVLNSAGNQFSDCRFYNFNLSAPTLCHARSFVTSLGQEAIHVEVSLQPWDRLKLIPSVGSFLSGKVYLRGAVG